MLSSDTLNPVDIHTIDPDLTRRNFSVVDQV